MGEFSETNSRGPALLAFLSSLAEARHMRYFSGVVGGSVNFCQVFALTLFCDKALTGETLPSTEFLLICDYSSTRRALLAL